jgi:hypothetical protein
MVGSVWRVDGSNDFARGIVEILGGDDVQFRACEKVHAEIDIRAFETHDKRQFQI